MLQRLLSDDRGSNTVELAFVVPSLILLTFGIVDFGRAVFDWNAVEKATQIGAREAIIRDPVATPIKNQFACDPANSDDIGTLCACPASGQCSGDGNGNGVKDKCEFANNGGVVCTSAGCTRNGATVAADKVAEATFDAIVAAMQGALPRLEPENVTITYKSSELGFLGKPDGPVAEVTVAVDNVPFDFFGLDIFSPIYGGTWTVPTLSTTLTAEDLNNNTCEEQGLVEGTVDGRLVCQSGGGGGGGGGGGNGNPVCF